MPNNKTVVSQEQIAHQYEYMQFIARMNEDKAQVRGQRPKAFTQTFGCQQNEADTQRIAGMLDEMGYEKTDRTEDADVIVINTCAVRARLPSACVAVWSSRSTCRTKSRRAIRRLIWYSVPMRSGVFPSCCIVA